MGLSLEKILKSIPLGRLPGDIFIARPHLSFYFPITTCIILSLFISGAWAMFRFFRK